jgi:membrane protein YqaA with SNARE-associated domain
MTAGEEGNVNQDEWPLWLVLVCVTIASGLGSFVGYFVGLGIVHVIDWWRDR